MISCQFTFQVKTYTSGPQVCLRWDWTKVAIWSTLVCIQDPLNGMELSFEQICLGLCWKSLVAGRGRACQELPWYPVSCCTFSKYSILHTRYFCILPSAVACTTFNLQYHTKHKCTSQPHVALPGVWQSPCPCSLIQTAKSLSCCRAWWIPSWVDSGFTIWLSSRNLFGPWLSHLTFLNFSPQNTTSFLNLPLFGYDYSTYLGLRFSDCNPVYTPTEERACAFRGGPAFE